MVYVIIWDFTVCNLNVVVFTYATTLTGSPWEFTVCSTFITSEVHFSIWSILFQWNFALHCLLTSFGHKLVVGWVMLGNRSNCKIYSYIILNNSWIHMFNFYKEIYNAQFEFHSIQCDLTTCTHPIQSFQHLAEK